MGIRILWDDFGRALNVGRIVVKDKLKYEVGWEIGYFNLGSTGCDVFLKSGV